MKGQRRFTIVFAPGTVAHVKAIDRRHHGLIRRVIEEQLSFTPGRETRNRKPLDPPAESGATWELRFGPGNRLRVFYEVLPEERTVWVLAIGVKDRDRLLIGREEFQL
jgi:mRNA-degrading endonuclease RelE of RelBE toxin-antitoxin system